MKKTILTVALAAALGTLAHAADAPPLADLSIKVNADYESQYVFRGKKITNGAIQPSINLSYPVGKDYGTVGAYVWNSEAEGRHGAVGQNTGPNQPNEIDIGATWDYDLSKAWSSLKNFSTEVGDQEYWYPQVSGAGTVSRSNELHFNVGYDTSDILKFNNVSYNIAPTFWYYHDVILDSNTVALSLTYTWALDNVTKGLSLVPSASFGWTGAHRTFGDQVPQPAVGVGPGVGNWRNSYAYWLISLEADYKIKDWATAFIGFRASGNNDGKTGGFGGVGSPIYNPQAPGGGQNNIWCGVGVYMGM